MISLTSDIRTPYHGWPVGPKLLALCLFTLAIFYLKGIPASLVVMALVCAAYLAGGVAFARQGLRMMRPVLFFVVIIVVWHLVAGSMAEGVVIILRLLAAIAAANLVTLTTRLQDMLQVIENGLSRFGVSEKARRRLAVSIALVIRFTPVLTQKGGHLVESWRARSTRRPGWRLVLPFALLAVDDAEQTAEALKARGGVL
ncbi:CbiQ family ECF transporter T component [Thalassovita sp.]|uniref:CbiQ family ECF transporter T component n=1 Tax=Thalassovita sp. TaxID=1979401 RepID=UPI0029DE58D4|nr:CbiQ family ECF transporter T component [Thalassovita sp.]